MKKYKIKYEFEEGLTFLREINEDEFVVITEAKEKTSFFLNFEESFEIVKMNIYEFWQIYHEACEKYRLRMMGNGNSSPSMIFNQKLANILSAFQSYQDHLAKKIKATFNEDATIFFKLQKSKVYDEYFSYRFFARLRNYFQHKGFPIKMINYHNEVNNEIDKYSISVSVKRDELLIAPVWSSVKGEIKKLPYDIDLKIYLNKFLYALSELHSVLRNYFQKEYNNSIKVIENIEIECEKHFYEVHEKKNQIKNKSVICVYKNDELNDVLGIPTSRISTLKQYMKKNNFPAKCLNRHSHY